VDQATHNKIVSFIWSVADDEVRDLKCRDNRLQLLADFEGCLNGFSPNVQDILDNFKFRNQLTLLGLLVQAHPP
jgi:hypothetical protein